MSGILTTQALVLVAIYLIGRMDTSRNSDRIRKENELFNKRDRAIDKWELYSKFSKDCEERGERMLEAMWLTKALRSEEEVDRITQEILNL